MCVGHFQEISTSNSVRQLLRGGISIGQLFIDDVMVLGEALLKSYYLEDKIANYPRIIIDKDIAYSSGSFIARAFKARSEQGVVFNPSSALLQSIRKK